MTSSKRRHRPSIVIAAHGSKPEACYVTTFQGPRSVWAAWRAGTYPAATNHAGELEELIRARGIRLGAYGDPTALPLDVVRGLVPAGAVWTGYTHQWRTCDPAWREIVLASVDTPQERLEAARAGWRTFRVARGAGELELRKGERHCPAAVESGKRTTCQACRACNGTGDQVGGKLPTAPRGAWSSPANGAVVYTGPSELDGRRIVGIVTGTRRPSANPKTGPMLQLWIMRTHAAPHVAQRTGADASVCGDCKLRPFLERMGASR
jgi:hypothetical protein